MIRRTALLGILSCIGLVPANAADLTVPAIQPSPQPPVDTALFWLAPEVGVLFLDLPDIEYGTVVGEDMSSDFDGAAPYIGLNFGAMLGTSLGGDPLRLEGEIFFTTLDSDSRASASPERFGGFAFVSPRSRTDFVGTTEVSIEGNDIEQSNEVEVDGTTSPGELAIIFQANVAQRDNPGSTNQFNSSSAMDIDTDVDQLNDSTASPGLSPLASSVHVIATDEGFAVFGIGNIAPRLGSFQG
jgi:hypothetical protein